MKVRVRPFEVDLWDVFEKYGFGDGDMLAKDIIMDRVKCLLDEFGVQYREYFTCHNDGAIYEVSTDGKRWRPTRDAEEARRHLPQRAVAALDKMNRKTVVLEAT